jgi:glycosyltransferase involved in cell wall biosynthesis
MLVVRVLRRTARVLDAVPASPTATPGVGRLAGRSGRADPREEVDLDLTLVVPYYNPGFQLASHLSDLADVLRGHAVRFEIIAVSDGSTDGSDSGIERLGPEVRAVRLPRNMGKGQALRVGFGGGRGEFIGFIDGDGDIPASTVGPFVACAKQRNPDFVIGSKRHPDSNVIYPPIRRFYSWGFQLLTKLLFGLNATDTQAGLKLARRDVIVRVLPLLEERGFAFDLELLAVAHRLGFDQIVELPIEIRERFSSSISLRAAWDMLLDAAGLFWRLRIVKEYDKADAASAAVTSASGAAN